jgi:hypothetical protein
MMKKEKVKKPSPRNSKSAAEPDSAQMQDESVSNSECEKTPPKPDAMSSEEFALRNLTPVEVAMVAAIISRDPAMDRKRACSQAIGLIVEASRQLNERLRPTSQLRPPKSPPRVPRDEEVWIRLAKRLYQLSSQSSGRAMGSHPPGNRDGGILFPITREELQLLDGTGNFHTIRKRIETTFPDKEEREKILSVGVNEDQFETLLRRPAWKNVKAVVEDLEREVQSEDEVQNPLWLDPRRSGN